MSAESEQIGPYMLCEILGEGGMAIVYLAEQSQPVKRTVAVKLLKPGMDSKQIVARFESERQTLALLEHPHIAKVYDAGTTPRGRPYFVMELVRGVSITRYCDEHQLDISSRVRLFMDVCAAVQHAHQKGMIHRDLKPSNILVERIDDKPIVKVIDFGIAKAIGTDAAVDRTQLTRLGQLVGTPLYMSPEQAQLSGPDVDTRSDIYSLGVVLYEMLAGAVPLELENIADYALGIALSERDPPTPSQRVAKRNATSADVQQARARQLVKILRGDLDWITMKAIAKDRSRRYQTANELAVDLDHYLNALPVLARAPSAGYLLTRFVRRNRIAVGAASLAALALIVGAAFATIGFVQARAAERKALTEAETARQVTSFMVGLFEVSDPGEARGNSVTAREVLDKGARQIDAQLKNQPLIQAQMMSTIARVYLGLGLYRDALPLADKALRVRRELSPNSLVTADSLDQLGQLQTLLSRPKDALPLHEQALQIRRQFATTASAVYAESLHAQGLALIEDSNYEAALEPLLAARKIQLLATDAQPLQRAKLAGDIAETYGELDRAAESEAFFREAIATLRENVGNDHPKLAQTLSDFATLLKNTRRYDEAEKANTEALAIYKKTLGARHPLVASLLNNMATMHLEMKENDQALAEIREAAAIAMETLGEKHEETNRIRLNVARVYQRRNEFAAAEKEYRAVLAVRRETLPADHTLIGDTLEALTAVLNREKRFADAEQTAAEARRILVQAHGPEYFRSVSANVGLGEALLGLRRYPEAEAALLSAYQFAAKGQARFRGIERAAAERLAQLYDAWQKPAQAAEYREKVQEINKR